jgi:hypothetical protein
MTNTQIAMLTVVVSAIGALATWRALALNRNQHANKDSYELAKRLNAHLLALESKIRTLRQGFWSDEQVLWHEINSIGLEVDAAFREGNVLWGDKFVALKRPLKDCVGELHLAKREVERNSKYNLSDEQKEKVWNKTSPILNASDANDEYAVRLRKAIKAIEKSLSPHLRRGWWHK